MKCILKIAAVFLATTIVIGSASWAQDICAKPVPTKEGVIMGLSEPGSKVCSFKGIPYAAPPVGELRLKAPQPASPRTKIYQAFDFGPSCVQNEESSSGGKSKSFSEDCLSLNIFRPAKQGSFPVMFWIHGGNHTQGGSSYEIYNGAKLAGGRHVVVVTFNYRLDALGFLALPELAKEDPKGSAGNYGLLDVLRALQWVHDNIEAFGGDPNNVTVFGESAGGALTCDVLASPLAAGIFHRAIIQSGGCDLVSNLDMGHKGSRTLAEAVGCSGADALSCLRAKPAKELVGVKNTKFLAQPHADGYALAGKPIDIIKQGNFNKVPVMVGSNKDEWNIVIAMTPGATLASRKTITKKLRKALGARVDDIFKMYSYNDYRRPVFLAGAIFADGFGSRAFAAAEEISPYAPVYMYRFDWDDEKMGKNLGAFHGLDVLFVFGNMRFKPLLARIVFNKKVRKNAAPLSEKMMSYWSNFAKTGFPNASGLVKWPRYTTQRRDRIHLDNNISVAPLTAKDIERYRYFAAISIEELIGNIEED